MSIKQKLIVLGVATTFVFVAVAGFAIRQIDDLDSLTTRLVAAHAVEGTIAAAYESWLLDDDQSNMYAAVVALGDPSQRELAETTFQQAIDGYNGAVKQLDAAQGKQLSGKERDILKELRATLDDYNKYTLLMRADALKGDVHGTVRAMTVDNLTPSNALPAQFQQLRTLEIKASQDLEKQLSDASARAKNILLPLTGAGLIAMAGSIWMLVRQISRPLNSVVVALEKVASGDLSVQLTHKNDDEIGRIAGSLNHAVRNLREAEATVERAQTDRLEREREERERQAAEAARERQEMAAAAERERAEAEREQQRVAEQHRLERNTAEAEAARQAETAEARRVASERERAAEIREQQQREEQLRRERDAAEKRDAEAKELSRKVDALLTTVNAVADGDLTQQIPVRGEDAIGRLGNGLDHLLTTLRASMSEIGRMASMLTESASQLTSLSEVMGRGASATSDRASSASSASTQVSASIQMVAAAAEEMTSSIREIAKNASNAAGVATQAVSVAGGARDTVASLGESSSEIGKVIKVITSIAQQTNLLALNATIEAARAGEAGKGFAVVANEVKELAKETARATEEIGQKVEAIQSDTQGAVSAIGEIGGIIDSINDIQTTIASAVEEQTATTNEIARSVTEAAAGANGISVDIAAVAGAASDTLDGAESSLTSANALAGMATELKQLLGQFRY